MNTTNINELPIDSNPPDNRDLPEQHMNSNINHMIDPNLQMEHKQKQVRFNDSNSNSNFINKTKNFELSDTHKIIILATVLFLLFSDTRVKSYIMNILEVIFGKYLKSAGVTNKFGILFYSIVYSVALFLCITFIDVGSINLSY